jgi:UMF1 family MFS transporter
VKKNERWLTRPVLAWALYDVASSTYIALVPTFFGLYYVTVVAADQPLAASRWGLVASLTLVLAGVLAPFVGALADERRWRLRVLGTTTALCAIATVAMGLTSRGGVLLAAGLFVAAQVGYTLAMSVYDSLLVEVARPQHVGRVSGFGWAIGFVGGIAALSVAIALMQTIPAGAQPASLGQVFMIAGLLMVLLAVPAFAALRGLLPRGSAPKRRAAARIAGVLGTLRRWRDHREAFRMLLGYYLINDALVTLVFFVAILLKARFGLSLEGLLWLALLYNVVALPSTFLFGWLADRWDKQRTIYAMVAILCLALLLLAFSTAEHAPVVVVVLLAFVYGSLQAVCRSVFMLLVPADRASEFFGFNAVAGRLSAALGPLAFGAVAAAAGNQAAVLMLVGMLLAGAAVLAGLRIPAPRVVLGEEPEAERAAV